MAERDFWRKIDSESPVVMVRPVIVRTHAQVDTVLNLAADATERDTTNWPGMTYETGITAMYDWLTGLQDDPPLGVG
jgi:hypothetical protein